MAAALNGNLRDFGIGEVFQLIGQQQKTGFLEVAEGGFRLRIAFESGSVVWGERVGDHPEAGLLDMLVRTGLLTPERRVALEEDAQDGTVPSRVLLDNDELEARELDEVVELVTRDTIFALLRWSKGSFHFTTQGVTHTREGGRLISAEQILMDGLRMVDEWRTFDEDTRRDDSVFRRVGRFETYRAANPGESPERLAVIERLFLLVDGRMSVRRLIDLSRHGDFEGARMLTALRRAGLIELQDPSVVQRRQRGRIALDLARGPGIFGAVLAVIPFVALGGVLALLATRAPLPPREPSTALARSLPLEARAAFADRRMRHAVEAYRFGFGEWPRDMEAVGGALGHWVGPAPMAGYRAGQYYYVQRRGTFVVLPPDAPAAGSHSSLQTTSGNVAQRDDGPRAQEPH
jgi:hypothetical protein